MEIQLQANVQEEEVVAWSRVLENLLAVVDVAKLDLATKGEWRKAIARCILHLLESSGKVRVNNSKFFY